jgi:hypothetical protein
MLATTTLEAVSIRLRELARMQIERSIAGVGQRVHIGRETP